MKTVFWGCAAVLALVGTAAADMETYSGSLINADPTFNRPLDNFASLSGIGTDVSYDVQPLWVDAAGSFDFSSIQTYDGFLLLYINSFDPNNALVNGVEGDDGAEGMSEFSASLIADTQYWLVTTAYGNDEFGDYTNTISGAGGVTLGVVPAPGAGALLALSGLAAVRRRRA